MIAGRACCTSISDCFISEILARRARPAMNYGDPRMTPQGNRIEKTSNTIKRGAGFTPSPAWRLSQNAFAPRFFSLARLRERAGERASGGGSHGSAIFEVTLTLSRRCAPPSPASGRGSKTRAALDCVARFFNAIALGRDARDSMIHSWPRPPRKDFRYKTI